MIRHLNPEAFRRFGIILSDQSSLSRKPNHHSIYLPGGAVSCYRTVAPIWLGAESGLAILSLSLDGSSFEDYFLDKTVQVKGGVWIELTGLGGSATVQMSGSSMPLELGQRMGNRDFAVRPKVRVESLYTVFYQEKEAGFVFSGEAHPMAELLYVDKGCVHSVADGVEQVLTQGEMMLYTPEQWHMQYADPDQAPCIATISFWAKGIDWERLSNRVYAYSQETADLMRQILKAQRMGNADSIFSFLTLLLLQMQAEAQNTGREKAESVVSTENTIIRRAQQYVQEHIAEKLTVSVLAQQIGVSASYLTALFHKHLSFSPGEYIRRIKLEQSKQMIREGRMNFTEIAENLQYSTVHHFSRQFKQMFDMTPTEYAKSVR